jgi:hypothetical protein
MLIFFGAAFTRVYAESRGKPIEPDRYGTRVFSDDHDWLPAAAAPANAPSEIAPAGSNDHVPWTGLLAAAAAGTVAAMVISGNQRHLRNQIAAIRLAKRLENRGLTTRRKPSAANDHSQA